MEGLRNTVQGLLIAVVYCLAFQLAWYCSLDQWYLPAGLRIAVLLFAPSRLSPWVVLADIAALLALRVPAITAAGVNPTWAYWSPWLLSPAIASVPLAIRAQCGKAHRIEMLLIPLLLVSALWGALCTIGVNILLDGPSSAISGAKLIRFFVGDYLGMLMVVLPALVWLRRHDGMSWRLHIHGVLATLVTGLLFILVALSHDGVGRLVLMALLVVPAIVLTCLHGWRGAVIGVILANISLAFLLRNTGVLRAYDADGFIVQVLLAMTATGLFALGARISHALDEARATKQTQRQALYMAKSSYLWAERSLRDRALVYADIHVHIDKLRRDIESYLRSRGQHEAALRMIRTGFIQSKMLEEYIAALYPLDIETHGLYYVFRSVGFANTCNTEIHAPQLRGRPMDLSMGLQLAAYRCTLQAIACLPPSTRHTIKARVGKTRHFQGIAVSIYADAAQHPGAGQAAPEAAAEFSSRIQSHGGTYRRHHACRISFFVYEPVGTRSLFRYDEPGPTTLGECL